MRSSIPFLLLLVAAGCGSKDTGAPSAAATSSAEAGATSSAAAPAPTTATSAQAPAGDDAIGACLDAKSKAMQMMNTDAAAADKTMRQGCAQLYKKEACRTAYVEASEKPVAERTHFIAVACKDAYCADLPDPKPGLCSKEVPTADDDPQALLMGWGELNNAILVLEHGEAGKARLDASAR